MLVNKLPEKEKDIMTMAHRMPDRLVFCGALQGVR
jgi:hypothetical protein